MKKRFSIITGATVFMVGIAGAAAGELPTYDIAGFLIMPHQMAVLGQSGAIQESRSGAGAGVHVPRIRAACDGCAL